VEKQQRSGRSVAHRIEPIPDSPQPLVPLLPPAVATATCPVAPSIEEQLKQKLKISPRGAEAGGALSRDEEADAGAWRRLLAEGETAGTSREPDGDEWASRELINPAAFEMGGGGGGGRGGGGGGGSVLQSSIDEQLRTMAAVATTTTTQQQQQQQQVVAAAAAVGSGGGGGAAASTLLDITTLLTPSAFVQQTPSWLAAAEPAVCSDLIGK
ncbi:PREDICTED: zinc finger protein 503-like, partial [Priapulus caudatus]|uniref:Zinc finger protein 503-like n=1 Tax=Priapulus caudatus TaxID=37621 RepID=A0ABM1F7J3_PRICU